MQSFVSNTFIRNGFINLKFCFSIVNQSSKPSQAGLCCCCSSSSVMLRLPPSPPGGGLLLNILEARGILVRPSLLELLCAVQCSHTGYYVHFTHHSGTGPLEASRMFSSSPPQELERWAHRALNFKSIIRSVLVSCEIPSNLMTHSQSTVGFLTNYS